MREFLIVTDQSHGIIEESSLPLILQLPRDIINFLLRLHEDNRLIFTLGHYLIHQIHQSVRTELMITCLNTVFTSHQFFCTPFIYLRSLSYSWQISIFCWILWFADKVKEPTFICMYLERYSSANRCTSLGHVADHMSSCLSGYYDHHRWSHSCFAP